jgi:hypothetical protein
MAQRQYEPFTLFNVRIVDMRHLWNPSTDYKGQEQKKPNYFAGFIVKKTQAAWSSEPALAGLVNALSKILATNPQIIDWRIQDGDTPSADGKSSEFAKGHWLFNASTSNPPNVEIAQPNGTVVKLSNKVGVKSGDYCMIGGTAAVSGQNNRAIKLYLNAVVFSGPGEEIVFANSVSGAELMKAAQAQGLQVAGFGAAPQHGQQFAGQPFAAPNQGAPGFTAPTTGSPAFGAAAAPFGSAGPGNSSASPFSQPGGFTPPVNPFGQR